MKNKMKRVRWNRVIMTAVVALGLIVGIGRGFQKLSSEPSIPEEYRTVEVVIMPGDKAWTIQRDLLPQTEDVRKALHHAEKLNDQNMGKLEVGQRITFFTMN